MTNGLCFIAGSSHPILAQAIAHRLGVVPAQVVLSKFSNQETNVEIGQSVRDLDVYILQSGCGQVNDIFMELLILVHACRIASARRVTVVIPYFPYVRQLDPPTSIKKMTLEQQQTFERIFGGMESIDNGYRMWTARSGKLVANMLAVSGCDHVITIDMHDAQAPGYFSMPVDNLYGQVLAVNYIKEHVPHYNEAVIVSPDAGGSKRATFVANKLGVEFALVHKERTRSSRLNGHQMMLAGDVSNRLCIIIDDIVDSGLTITRAAAVLVEAGAKRVVALITHGLFPTPDALQRLNQSALDEVIVSNTIPQESHMNACSKIKVMDVSSVLAESIRRIHNGESVSVLFDTNRLQ